MRGLLRALGSSTISNRKIARRAGFVEILPWRSEISAVGGGLSSVLTAFRNTACSVSDTAEMASESGTRARAPLTLARADRPRACRCRSASGVPGAGECGYQTAIGGFWRAAPARAHALRGQNDPPHRQKPWCAIKPLMQLQLMLPHGIFLGSGDGRVVAGFVHP